MNNGEFLFVLRIYPFMKEELNKFILLKEVKFTSDFTINNFILILALNFSLIPFVIAIIHYELIVIIVEN